MFQAVSIASSLARGPAIEMIITMGALSLIPFLVGTIALVGVGVICAVNQSRDEQLTALRHAVYAVEALRGAPPAGYTVAPYVTGR